jgi:hypothetical protein
LFLCFAFTNKVLLVLVICIGLRARFTGPRSIQCSIFIRLARCLQWLKQAFFQGVTEGNGFITSFRISGRIYLAWGNGQFGQAAGQRKKAKAPGAFAE